MKTTLFSIVIIIAAGCGRLLAQTEPSPVATPADIPILVVQPSPSATPEATPAAAPAPMATDTPTPAMQPSPTPTPTATPRPLESEEDTLTKLEQDWGEAIARHDADFLERTESDDYTYTGPDGIVSHKADEITGAKAGLVQIESFEHRDLKTHVYGDTAVVTGATTLKGTVGDTDLSGEFRWTDVFVKRNGQWQVVASQATAIGKPGPED